MTPKLNDVKTVQLVFFSGTYCTIWEPPYPTDDNGDVCAGTLDFDLYLHYISAQITHQIAELLPIQSSDIKLLCAYSPIEYNSHTDTIIISMSNYRNNINLLRGYAEYHKLPFQRYLTANYQSYDGFVSYYSNDYDYWSQQDSSVLDDIQIGTYLSFYLINEVNGYINEYIHNTISDDIDDWIFNNFKYEES